MKKFLFLFICFMNISAFAQVSSEGLVAYFPFNNNSADESGNKNHGKVFGATLTKDRLGNPNAAYYFDGNDHIRVEDSPTLRLKTITYSAWYKFDDNAPSTQLFFGKHIGTGYLDSYAQWIEGGELRGSVGDNDNFGNYIRKPFNPEPNIWYHLVYMFDDVKNIQKMYINGAIAVTQSETKSVEYDNEPLLIGAGNDWLSPHFFFYGTIDDVRIYNRLLNDKEIVALCDPKSVIVPPKDTTKKDTIILPITPKKDTTVNPPFEVKIYPIPVETDLTVKANYTITKINLYDVLGQLLYSRNYNAKKLSIDVSLLYPAPYFIEIIAEGDNQKTFKFIKI
jgi:hypothetical protein